MYIHIQLPGIPTQKKITIQQVEYEGKANSCSNFHQNKKQKKKEKRKPEIIQQIHLLSQYNKPFYLLI